MKAVGIDSLSTFASPSVEKNNGLLEPQLTAPMHEQTMTTPAILFPRPFAFAIDDLGWMNGENSVELVQPGPYRIGLNRKMSVDDYHGIIAVAQEVGVRVLGLFVLAELDMKNILAHYPATTWMGKNWDNSQLAKSGHIEPIIECVKDNAAYLEFGLHGIGHEYWLDTTMKRAEWYCVSDGHPWPKEHMLQHIEAVKDLLAQHGLDSQHGHSFPESFVPSAYSFHWNPEGDFSTGSLLKEQGSRYANTLFDFIEELDSPKGDNNGGFDHGLLVVNRINYGIAWDKPNTLPSVPLHQQRADIIESHWANWLARNPAQQDEVNKRWIAYYRAVQQSEDRYLAKNSEQFYSQWLYKRYTRVVEEPPGRVVIDNRFMGDEAYSSEVLGNMVLKILTAPGVHISSASLDGNPISCLYEDSGYTFFFLPKLQKKRYELCYEFGEHMMTPCIYNDGTYSVYSFWADEGKIEATMRLYGTQEITIRGVQSVNRIMLSNNKVRLKKQQLDTAAKILKLSLNAHDYQGETTRLVITGEIML